MSADAACDATLVLGDILVDEVVAMFRPYRFSSWEE